MYPAHRCATLAFLNGAWAAFTAANALSRILSSGSGSRIRILSNGLISVAFQRRGVRRASRKAGPMPRPMLRHSFLSVGRNLVSSRKLSGVS